MSRLQRSATVRVWTASTDCLDGPDGARLRALLLATLDEAERERLQRLRFERDRAAFLLSHGLCRVLLGRAMGTEGAYLGPYLKGQYGKPRVRGGVPCFSLSHSAPWVAVMVSPRAACGVDIEVVRDLERSRIVLDFCLGEHERRVMRESSDPQHAFMKIWTLKEAYLKALGVGLHRPMNEFSVIDCAGAVTTSDDHLQRMQAYHRRAEGYHIAAWMRADTRLAVHEHHLAGSEILALGQGAQDRKVPRQVARLERAEVA